jgi:hypothetical protein
MKNSIALFLLIWISGCTTKGPIVKIALNLKSLDSVKMECFYDYEAKLSESAHSGIIDRSMQMFFTLKPSVSAADIFITPTRLIMTQNMPGSGKQSIDTDHPDSSLGHAATMTLRRFAPLNSASFLLSLETDQKEKANINDWNNALKRSGISDLSAFIENHPIHIGLEDGEWYKGKEWETDITLTEAGIPMKGTTHFLVDSCNKTHCYVTAIKEITEPENYQDYTIVLTASIQGKILVNQANGWMDEQIWNENIDMKILKGKEVIPVKIKRTGGYRINR